MIDSVFQLLFRHEAPISEKQIAMFHGYTKTRDLEMLQGILKTDHRFHSCRDNLWQCAPLSELIPDDKISEIDFIITDIESTGSLRGTDRIIDLAAVKIRNGQEIGRFESLVNPQKEISDQIVRLTGITNEAVSTAPTIEEILPKFIEFVDKGIFVAHNSLFDYHFINAEIRRLQLPELESRMEICTFRLAKKLLPDVRARGVSGLAEYYNYTLENRHRAMPDVLATKYYFERFLEELGKQDIHNLHQLVLFQKEIITKKKIKKKIKSFLRKKAHFASSKGKRGSYEHK